MGLGLLFGFHVYIYSKAINYGIHLSRDVGHYTNVEKAQEMGN